MRSLLLIFVISCCSIVSSFAGMGDSILTKRIYRTVDISDTSHNSSGKWKLKLEDIDTPLSEILIKMATRGKVKAYSAEDSSFSKILTNDVLIKMVTPRPDTECIYDPAVGGMMKIIRRDMNYDDIVKFSMLEEWVYERRTGHTSIQIVGIAPLQDIYSDNGEYKGYKPMFWLKYDDVQDVVKRYEKEHPSKNIPLAIWEDYFSEENK